MEGRQKVKRGGKEEGREGMLKILCKFKMRKGHNEENQARCMG